MPSSLDVLEGIITAPSFVQRVRRLKRHALATGHTLQVETCNRALDDVSIYNPAALACAIALRNTPSEIEGLTDE